MKSSIAILVILLFSIFTYAKTADDYFMDGVSKMIAEDYKAAIHDYNKAIELKPDFVEAYIQRGTAYFKLGDYKAALQNFSKYMESEPIYSYNYFYRLGRSGTQGDYMEAIQGYSRIISHNPDYSYAYFFRGLAKSALGDYRGAIQDYTRTINLRPDYAHAYFYRGLANIELLDGEAAIRDFSKFIKFNHHKNKSNNYINKDSSKNSDMVIRFKSDSAYAYLKMGMAKTAAKQKESGCLDLSKAGELGMQTAYDLIRKLCKYK